MRTRFLQTFSTPAVEKAQAEAYGRIQHYPTSPIIQPLGPEEKTFIASRDSFYMASVSESGWPYVQHRGGPKGFVQVTGENGLAFGDYNGNRQLISTGNVEANRSVALFFMDYRARERLKIIGQARVVSPTEARETVGALAVPPGAKIERVFLIEVVGFDWNCPKYITPRYTTEEIAAATQPLRDRIAQLEKELASARSLKPS
jgi:hypothetical protein